MADNSILIPGCLEIDEAKVQSIEYDTHLRTDKHLEEWEKDSDAQNDARRVLGLSGGDDLFVEGQEGSYGEWSKTIASEILNLSNNVTYDMIRSSLAEHIASNDPHGIQNKIQDTLDKEHFVKKDGSIPFENPEKCDVPVAKLTDPKHLTTRELVEKLIKAHADTKAQLSPESDPHGIVSLLKEILVSFAKSSDVYLKEETYNKVEVNNLTRGTVKSNGSVPFTAPLSGVDPVSNSHLTTKRYVDLALYKHLTDVDPHGFLSILNNRLIQYAKKSDVFDKTQTYSRSQIDNIIYKLVDEAIEASLADYKETIDNRFETLRNEKYVKQDGSIPFVNPQSGVDAEKPEDFITLRQLIQKHDELKKSLEKDFGGSIWKTSGPVLTTVGYLEDNTPVPAEMSFLEVCDAIFYGSGISISVPDHVNINESCEITVCIKGSTGLVENAQLFQNGELIYTFVGSDFEDGCVTVKSKNISEDTEFEFKVTYTNGSQHEETAKVQCQLPVFVGIIPKWKQGYVVTMDYLKELVKEDPVNNKFISGGKSFKEITINYNFKDPKLRRPFVVLPNTYPNLVGMTTKTQQFGIDAFDEIQDIPIAIEGVEKDIIYKIYVYGEALATLNLEVTFNFE